MRSPSKLSLAQSGLLLMALMPVQLAIEFAVAYFSPRVRSQLVFGGPDGEFRLAPVRYILVDVPLVPFTRHLLVVTFIAFLIGIGLLVFATVRKMFLKRRPPSNQAMQRTAPRYDA